jgi:hypothetical protein
MVDFLTADASLSVRDAALQAAGENTDPNASAERLRKKYRALRRLARLPEPRKPDQTESKLATIRALYRQSAAETVQARSDLAKAEAEAKDLGLDLGENLVFLTRKLETRRDNLELLTRSTPDLAYSLLVNSGIRTPEEAESAYLRAHEELPTVTAKIALLRRIRNLRHSLGVVDDLSNGG